MNYSDTLKLISSRQDFSIPPTLTRIKTVLGCLSNSENSFPAIHIAGTNGKGSVAVMTAQILAEEGYKTGLFTSPFIVDFRERIRINGEFIPESALCRLTEKVLATGIELTRFELITAVAFLYFSEEKCDVAVLETGLGGRLDATNAIPDNMASVITKIGLDHTEVLGDTLSQIAAEKCGIIKTGFTVTSANQPQEALSVIKEKSLKLIIPDTDKLNVLKSDYSGNRFIYKSEIYETSLVGDFQIENALSVIELMQNINFEISPESIKAGLKNAKHPARFESFLNGRVILDGAHNPDAAEALIRQLSGITGATAIIGMMADKDCDTVLSMTLPYFSRVITVETENSKRSAKAEYLADLARKYCNEVSVASNYSDALNMALNDGKSGKTVIFGSLYLASAIRPLLLELK